MTTPKFFFPLALAAQLLWVAPVFPQEFPDFGYVERIADARQQQYKNFEKAMSSTTGNEYDLTYHRFQWIVDPAVRELTGEVTSYFTIVNDNTQLLTFDFSDTLIIDSVIYHGSLLTWSLTGDVLSLQLPVPLGQSAVDSVSVFYHGVPRVTGNMAYFQDIHGPMDVPVIWTLSEPYGAKEWWPCKQNLNDKADSIDVFITTPLQYRAASNGMLQSETISGPWKTAHWKHRYPIAAYLIAMAVTDYSVYSDYVPRTNGDSIQVLNYVYPEDSAVLWTQGKCIIDVMQLYDTLFIEYPFVNERYGHAQFGWAGGMEHQTMSFMYNFSFELVAHELAHMWFGDYITCGSWEDIWLNEGFATYLAGLSYENLFGGYYWPFWKEDQIDRITEYPDGSVFCSDTNSVARIFSSRLSYRKGAYLLHMLRWEIGNAAFFSAIRNYLNDSQLANNYAVTPNLVAHLEAIAGTSLSEFFSDWYFGEGYPVYSIYWSQQADSMFSMTIDQTQTHGSVGFFEMHLPIQLWGNGQDTIYRIQHDFSGENFIFFAPFMVDSVILDPDMWIITKDALIQHVPPEIEKNTRISIYPNPSTGSFTLEIPDGLVAEKLLIYSDLGEIVLMEKIESKSSLFIIDNQNIASGVYVLEIMTNLGNIKKMLVIQR